MQPFLVKGAALTVLCIAGLSLYLVLSSGDTDSPLRDAQGEFVIPESELRYLVTFTGNPKEMPDSDPTFMSSINEDGTVTTRNIPNYPDRTITIHTDTDILYFYDNSSWGIDGREPKGGLEGMLVKASEGLSVDLVSSEETDNNREVVSISPLISMYGLASLPIDPNELAKKLDKKEASWDTVLRSMNLDPRIESLKTVGFISPGYAGLQELSEELLRTPVNVTVEKESGNLSLLRIESLLDAGPELKTNILLEWELTDETLKVSSDLPGTLKDRSAEWALAEEFLNLSNLGAFDN